MEEKRPGTSDSYWHASKLALEGVCGGKGVHGMHVHSQRVRQIDEVACWPAAREVCAVMMHDDQCQPEVRLTACCIIAWLKIQADA